MVRWLTAFLDLPASTFDASVAFWCNATASTLSPPRGEHGEFASLVPAAGGDAHLRVQRTVDGSAGVHLDVHTDVPAVTADRLLGLGARVLREHAGYVTLASPGGLVFCLVPFRIDGVRTPAVIGAGGERSLADQLCIDVPVASFESELAFWSAATGWSAHRSALAEFASLERPTGQPLRLLLQRLGDDDAGRHARAHLDLACGDGVDAVAAVHESLGARVVRRERFWTTLTEPSGLAYCLTRRDPVTGTL